MLTLAATLVAGLGSQSSKIPIVSTITLLGLLAAFGELIFMVEGISGGSVQVFMNSVSVDGIALYFKLYFTALAILHLPRFHFLTK